GPRIANSSTISTLLLSFLGVAVVLCLTRSAQAQEGNGPIEEAPAATIQSWTLEDCVQHGLANQPALRAAQASAAGAQAQYNALETMRLARLISHELKIRREQASLGVVAANAEINKIEWDTIYAITRNYFSAVYAHQQELVIRQMIDNLIEKRE